MLSIYDHRLCLVKLSGPMNSQIPNAHVVMSVVIRGPIVLKENDLIKCVILTKGGGPCGDQINQYRCLIML